MPNQTCRLLSNGYKFDCQSNGKLRLRPCCLLANGIEVTNTNCEQVIAWRDKISQIDSYTNPGCHECNFFEKKELRKTWRQQSFSIVPEDAINGDSYYLELQLDYVCNGGCIMCGPQYSSYWQQEMIKHSIPITPIQQTDHIDKILNLINIQKLRKILFLGGEPFLATTDQKILPLISYPENVDLQYTTNGSIYPTQDRINLWKKFKSVVINFSIDGVGNRFEYVRYPLKWNIVQQNILKMRNELSENIHFKFNHTVNILNLYYWDEFESWLNCEFSQDRFGRITKFNFNPAAGLLQPYTVTEKLRSLIIEKYGQESRPFRSIKYVQQDKNNVLQYLSELDQRRNQNWREIFPEIAHCL